MDTTRVLAFEEFGRPDEVLRLIEEPLPPTGPGQVRVRMEASPINPSDLNYVEGVYGIKPSLPARGGLEGAGRVVEVGSGVTNVKEGDLVTAPRVLGNWREAFVAPASEVRPFPPGLTPEQAALFRINPMTAWAFLHEIVPLKPGSWIVQNAATSAVGRQVVALAKRLGYRTLNLVRREEDIAPLKALGGDIVVVADVIQKAMALPKNAVGGAPVDASLSDLIKGVRSQIGKDPVLLGLNAVGGDSATLVSKFLSPDSFHVTYGAMSRQPVKTSNAALIFSNMTYRGFWLTRWLATLPEERLRQAEEEVAACFREGVFQAEVSGRFSLSDFKPALTAAIQGGKGKQIFKLPGV